MALDKSRNMIRVEQAGAYLRLVVDAEMLNFEKPVQVLVDGGVHTVSVRPTGKIAMETVRQRGDPRYIFYVGITLVRTSQGSYMTVVED